MALVRSVQAKSNGCGSPESPVPEGLREPAESDRSLPAQSPDGPVLAPAECVLFYGPRIPSETPWLVPYPERARVISSMGFKNCSASRTTSWCTPGAILESG